MPYDTFPEKEKSWIFTPVAADSSSSLSFLRRAPRRLAPSCAAAAAALLSAVLLLMLLRCSTCCRRIARTCLQEWRDVLATALDILGGEGKEGFCERDFAKRGS